MNADVVFPQNATVPMERRIFVNRHLHMANISAIGFDMDYTIARYRRQAVERLAYDITINKLIQRGYPEEIRKIPYDPHFVIRGLIVDKQLGNIIKLDRHREVCRGFHGSTKLKTNDIRNHYFKKKTLWEATRFTRVDTLFSLPEVCLYAKLIDYSDAHAEFKKSYSDLFEDTRSCIDEAHADDSLKSIVSSNLETYLERDLQLPETLHRLRCAGKKLFLLTNSLLPYTEKVMTYLLNSFHAEYPSWRDYFDIVMVGAQKPSFFSHLEPFVEIDDNNQNLGNIVRVLERGHLYQGGNFTDLEATLGIHGEQILYVGDHIYGDILRTKKAGFWRTALVVEELEDDIRHTLTHAPVLSELETLAKERRYLATLAGWQTEEANQQIPGSSAQIHTQIAAEETRQQVKRLDEQMHRLGEVIDRTYNNRWGMIFKDKGHTTRFGEQVSNFACVYTGRVSNFGFYDPQHEYWTPPDLMPHEQDIRGW